MVVVAIDPGREKCGVAAMDGAVVLARAVVPTSRLVVLVSDWIRRYRAERILLGDRTGSEKIRRLIKQAVREVPLDLVSEASTTLDARTRYFREHPPRGWRRLIPLSLQAPSEPYDDYAAIVMAERYLSAHKLINTK